MTNRNEFGHDTTTDEVLDGIDLTGKTVLITGGSSGIGTETARAMAAKGARIIFTGRDMEKGEAAVASIKASTGNDNIEVMSLDLASFASVRTFAEQFLAKYDAINILINNAGIMACPQWKTEDGYEMQFGTNHLGHFLLTNLLTPALIKGANGAPSRIVNLSSRAHTISPVVFDDIQFKEREYEKWAAYGQAKTANILHAVELERRLADKEVHAYAVHPGVIMTGLARHLDEADLEGFSSMTLKTVPAGAATSVYAATAPELEGRGGLYLYDCTVSELAQPDSEITDLVRPYAVDPEAAEKLWAISEEMVNQS